jgi:hypothetical protein
MNSIRFLDRQRRDQEVSCDHGRSTDVRVSDNDWKQFVGIGLLPIGVAMTALVSALGWVSVIALWFATVAAVAVFLHYARLNADACRDAEGEIEDAEGGVS